MSKSILIIHGPNLNRLGQREVDVYGTDTLDHINTKLHDYAKKINITVQPIQSNHEGDIIEAIHDAQSNYDGIIINPAAYTHTSIAIRDAISSITIPVVEVHLSNIYSREEFRQHSFFSDIAVGVISGLGAQGYQLALQVAVSRVESTES